MSSYFYALIECRGNVDDDDIFEFSNEDDGFSKLVNSINEIRVKQEKKPLDINVSSIKMMDISSHGVFIRPREVGIDTGYFAGQAGCFIDPLTLKDYIDDEYEIGIVNKYIELDALMFIC